MTQPEEDSPKPAASPTPASKEQAIIDECRHSFDIAHTRFVKYLDEIGQLIGDQTESEFESEAGYSPLANADVSNKDYKVYRSSVRQLFDKVIRTSTLFREQPEFRHHKKAQKDVENLFGGLLEKLDELNDIVADLAKEVDKPNSKVSWTDIQHLDGGYDAFVDCIVKAGSALGVKIFETSVRDRAKGGIQRKEREWNKEHPDQPMPENLRIVIEKKRVNPEAPSTLADAVNLSVNINRERPGHQP